MKVQNISLFLFTNAMWESANPIRVTENYG